ncbi:MAG: hypothetical protein KGJ57_17550 [Sphingomonadales bacterium]|nr:hypothetical protein [Sphingomonadales bacterium]MDE2171204.1 hypothetical protein [Sphingomonadales bacterium]
MIGPWLNSVLVMPVVVTVLAVLGCALFVIALIARANALGWRGVAFEAAERANRAEAALEEIRRRRSQATSKGNRTKALNRRAHGRAAKALREPEFSLPPGQTGDAR